MATSTKAQEQLHRKIERIERVIADPSILEDSYAAHREYGNGYGYRDAADWFDTEVVAAKLDMIEEPTFVTEARDARKTAKAEPAKPSIPDDVVEYFKTQHPGDNAFIDSVRMQAVTKGRLSEKQIAAVRSNIERDKTRATAKAEAITRGPLEDGMYRTPEGVIYKIKHSVGSGHQYAQILVQRDAVEGGFDFKRGYTAAKDASWGFDYAPGAMKNLTPEMRMTLDEAKAFGALYGTCCVCGRTLSNEESITAGIGPVCASKEWGAC